MKKMIRDLVEQSFRSSTPSRALDPLQQKGDSASRRSRLVTKQGLKVFGDMLLKKERAKGISVALVVLDFGGLYEERGIGNADSTSQMVKQVLTQLLALASPSGMVARIAPTQFAVLLAGCTKDEAAQRIARAAGNPVQFKLKLADQHVLIEPGIEIEAATADVQCVMDLCDELSGYLEQRKTKSMEPEPVVQLASTRLEEVDCAADDDSESDFAYGATLPMPLSAQTQQTVPAHLMPAY